ncbi:MAG: AAA family ATPase [Muribaculaceae bacterium]|nr:AAA family ATPase [Muribaculaceae bacterium]
MKNRFTKAFDFFKKLSETTCLYNELWKEHTIALLKSPRETDKTPLISDIIESITNNNRGLIYVNTEHRADSFVGRFASNEDLMIFTPEFESPDSTDDYADIVIKGIEDAVIETGIQIFIIDSVTRIAAMSFGKNSSPAYIMKRLAVLQSRYNLSFLVIAHTSTKSVDRALKTLSDCEIPMSEENNSDAQDFSAIFGKPAADTKTEVVAKPSPNQAEIIGKNCHSMTGKTPDPRKPWKRSNSLNF